MIRKNIKTNQVETLAKRFAETNQVESGQGEEIRGEWEEIRGEEKGFRSLKCLGKDFDRGSKKKGFDFGWVWVTRFWRGIETLGREREGIKW